MDLAMTMGPGNVRHVWREHHAVSIQAETLSDRQAPVKEARL